MAVVGLACSGVVATGTPAQAADIPGAVTNMVVRYPTGTPVPPDGPVLGTELLRLTADWAVPDGSSAGDTFGFTMPIYFGVADVTFNLTTETGATAGTCRLLERDVTCTLGTHANGRVGLHGTLWFNDRISVEDTEIGNTITLDFGTAGQTTVTISDPSEPNPAKASKYGGLYDSEVEWVVYLPNSVHGLDNVTVTDTPGPGQKCPAAGTSVDLYGIRTHADRQYIRTLRAEEVSSVGDGFRVSFINNWRANDAGVVQDDIPQYYLQFECDRTDTSLDKYTNQATITADEYTTEVVSGEVHAITGGGSVNGDVGAPRWVGIQPCPAGQGVDDEPFIRELSGSVSAGIDSVEILDDSSTVVATIDVTDGRYSYTPETEGTYGARSVHADGSVSSAVWTTLPACAIQRIGDLTVAANTCPVIAAGQSDQFNTISASVPASKILDGVEYTVEQRVNGVAKTGGEPTVQADGTFTYVPSAAGEYAFRIVGSDGSQTSWVSTAVGTCAAGAAADGGTGLAVTGAPTVAMIAAALALLLAGGATLVVLRRRTQS